MRPESQIKSIEDVLAFCLKSTLDDCLSSMRLPWGSTPRSEEHYWRLYYRNQYKVVRWAVANPWMNHGATWSQQELAKPIRLKFLVTAAEAEAEKDHGVGITNNVSAIVDESITEPRQPMLAWQTTNHVHLPTVQYLILEILLCITNHFLPNTPNGADDRNNKS